MAFILTGSFSVQKPLPPLDQVGYPIAELDEIGVGHFPGPREVVVNGFAYFRRFVGQYQNPVGKIDGLLDVMGNKDDGGPGFLP